MASLRGVISHDFAAVGRAQLQQAVDTDARGGCQILC